jgi:hypothetical protein
MNLLNALDQAPEIRTGRLLRFFRSVLQTVVVFTICGCGGATGPQCDQATNKPPDTIGISGIYFTDAAVFGSPLVTQGETLTIPITVQSFVGEAGTTSTVTPFSIHGVTFQPESIPVVMPPELQTKDVVFHAKIAANMVAQDYDLTVRRDSRQAENGFAKASTIMRVRNNLVSATITPTTANVAPGLQRAFKVSVLPRGDTEGPVNLTVAVNSPKLTVQQNFTVNMVLHSSVPVDQNLVLTVAENATSQDSGPLKINQGTREVCRADVTVGSGSGAPSLLITANPLQIVAPFNAYSAPVAFTVTSVNGFSGSARITYPTNTSIVPSPDTNNFLVDVSPGHPAVFSLKMYSFATDSDYHSISFTASDIPRTIANGVTIRVKHP